MLHFAHLFGGEAEDEDIILAHLFHDLDVGAVQRADGERAVKGELHIAGAGGFFAGGGNLLGKVRRRDEFLRQRHAVIRQEDHLELILHRRVALHHVGDAIDEVDDELGAIITRRRFAADDAGARHMHAFAAAL